MTAIIKWWRVGQVCLATVLLGSFSTAPADGRWLPLPDGEITRIAFGSCAKQWQAQPVWDAVIAAEPDLFLFLGDTIYADTDGKDAWDVTADQLAGEWNRFANKPEVQRLMEAVPVMATWDNHDYGTHDGGSEFPLKRESLQIFLDFFDEPTDSLRRRSGGVYDARIFGPDGRRVQIILLDTRSFRNPPDRDRRPDSEKRRLNIVGNYAPTYDPGMMLLGDEQWLWLEQQFREDAELRLIASGIQIIPDEKGMDEWGNYPLERQALFDLIDATGANNVVFLSGNVHFAEISRVAGIEYPLVEFTSSGLTHINAGYSQAVNSYRTAGPVVRPNFGLVEIDWEAEPGPTLTFSVITVGRQTALSWSIPLDKLQ